MLSYSKLLLYMHPHTSTQLGWEMLLTSLSTTPLRCLKISLVEGTPLLVLGTPLALIRLATTLEALLAGALVGISEVSSLMTPLRSSGMCVNASFLQSVGGEGTLLMEGSLVGSQVVALLTASLGFHRKHIMYITLDCHTYHMCVCVCVCVCAQVFLDIQ